MRLADLNPKWWQRYARFTPEDGGIDPLPETELSFRCPKCGDPGRVRIIVGTEPPDQSKGRWHVDALPQSPAWVETLTVTPSIQCHALMHGPRRPPCNAHFSIINGEIVP